jgi:hypothetical protein
LVAHYNDGHSDTTFYPNNIKKEFLFDTLPSPIGLLMDESQAMLSWGKPAIDNDVIGGSFINMPVGHDLSQVWPEPNVYFVPLGEDPNFVSFSWYWGTWLHNQPHLTDCEGLWFGQAPNYGTPTIAANAFVKRISAITQAGALLSDHYWVVAVLDATTSPDGIGEFVVYQDTINGYFAATRMDDYHSWDDATGSMGKLDLTWWFQTNGSDDFSTAYNYYPREYYIYLDGVIIDTIILGYDYMYENDYEYQLEGLVVGQTYTAGIEAVYNVGKSEMATIDFSPTVGIEENSKASPLLNIYPNPVTSQASISYVLYEAGSVTIEVFDVMGKKVKTLLNKNVPAGEYNISWDGKNDNGVKLIPGIYLFTLKTAQHASTRRIVVN